MNIVPLLTLEEVRIPRERDVKQLAEVSGFGGNAFFTLDNINLDLTIGLIRAATRCHVIDARTSCHLMLRRLWIHIESYAFHVPSVPQGHLEGKESTCECF